MVCFQFAFGINSGSHKNEYKQRIELIKCSYEYFGLKNGSSFVSFRCVMRAHSSFVSSIRLHFYFRSLYSSDWCQRLSAVAAVACICFLFLVYCCTLYIRRPVCQVWRKTELYVIALCTSEIDRRQIGFTTTNKSIKNGRTAYNLIFLPIPRILRTSFSTYTTIFTFSTANWVNFPCRKCIFIFYRSVSVSLSTILNTLGLPYCFFS